MLDSLEALRAAVRAGQRFEYVFFWVHRSDDGPLTAKCLSQWWPCRFTLEGREYTSTEQWMMAGKARLFGDDDTLTAIMAESEPGKVKALGRKVRGFDPERWAGACFDLVTRGNIAKFSQDPDLRAFLLGTGERVLVEASPLDAIWGIGLGAEDERASDPLRWEGQNLLGFALMRAREAIREGR